jgi:hypothetical protein
MHAPNKVAHGSSARRLLLRHVRNRSAANPVYRHFPTFSGIKKGLLRTLDFALILMFRQKNVCDRKNLTTDLRLRLLSNPKLVILTCRTLFEARPDGRARKRSCEGIPVPGLGRE